MPTPEQDIPNQQRNPSSIARYLLLPREQRHGYELDPPSHLQFWAWMAVIVVGTQAVLWILRQAGVVRTSAASDIVTGLLIVAGTLGAPMVLRKRRVMGPTMLQSYLSYYQRNWRWVVPMILFMLALMWIAQHAEHWIRYGN